MKGGLLLDVVVRKSSSIFQLLSSKDQPLLVWGDALLVLDLGLDILNGVRRLHLQGDGLASQGLHKDLHSSSQSQHKMEGRLLLDVVVRKSPSIFQLLSGEDEPLLVRGNSLLVLRIKILNIGRKDAGELTYLDFSLDVLDRVARFNLQGDGLASESLDEDLHTAAEPEDQVEGALLLDVVVGEGSSVLQLLAGEDEPLLVRGDALLVLEKRVRKKFKSAF